MWPWRVPRMTEHRPRVGYRTQSLRTQEPAHCGRSRFDGRIKFALEVRARTLGARPRPQLAAKSCHSCSGLSSEFRNVGMHFKGIS